MATTSADGGLTSLVPSSSLRSRLILIASKNSYASYPRHRPKDPRMPDPAKILGVDDEADFEALIRQRFRRQIRDGEFTFRFAHDGEKALDLLAAEPDIELILLDINMPVMDGLTLLNELRERQSPVRGQQI